jgi:hypothetical protein
MRQSVITIGDGLVGTMQKTTFSQLLADLILDAQERQTAGQPANPEKNLKELLELLAENRALKATIKELGGDKVEAKPTKKGSPHT